MCAVLVVAEHKQNGNVSISVKDRPKVSQVFLEEVLHASPAVREVIELGYGLLCLSKPTPFVESNLASSRVNAEVVIVSIEQLLHSCYVSEVDTSPVILSPLWL